MITCFMICTSKDKYQLRDEEINKLPVGIKINFALDKATLLTNSGLF